MHCQLRCLPLLERLCSTQTLLRQTRLRRKLRRALEAVAAVGAGIKPLTHTAIPPYETCKFKAYTRHRTLQFAKTILNYIPLLNITYLIIKFWNCTASCRSCRKYPVVYLQLPLRLLPHDSCTRGLKYLLRTTAVQQLNRTTMCISRRTTPCISRVIQSQESSRDSSLPK